MKNNTPYSEWPWWVKLYSNFVFQKSSFLNEITGAIMFLGFGICISYGFFFDDINPLEYVPFAHYICYNLALLQLFKAFAIRWIDKHSDWNLRETSLLQRIMSIIAVTAGLIIISLLIANLISWFFK